MCYTASFKNKLIISDLFSFFFYFIWSVFSQTYETENEAEECVHFNLFSSTAVSVIYLASEPNFKGKGRKFSLLVATIIIIIIITVSMAAATASATKSVTGLLGYNGPMPNQAG